MSVKDAQRRRSRQRAAKKRAKTRSGIRRPVVEMTDSTFRKIAAPIVAEVAKKNNVSEDIVEMVVEMMADDGSIGLSENGQLASRLQ